MSRSERFIGTTYYEILECYFEKLYEEPLTNAERAFMASLLHLCNRARGDEISMSVRMLASVVLMRPSTVGQCLDSLSSKGYLEYTATSTKCTISVRKLYVNRPKFEEKSGSTPNFSEVREEKTREDKKETNFEKSESVEELKRQIEEISKPKVTVEEVKRRIAEFSKH